MDELIRLIPEYGHLGLLVVSFIGATIIPLSSEAAMLAAIEFGLPPGEALLWASIGNCMGVLLNYWLGRLFTERVCRRLEGGMTGRKALAWIERYGAWTLLLSWAPFIGDPLTVAAGIFRINFLVVVLVAFSLRVLRYVVILAAV